MLNQLDQAKDKWGGHHSLIDRWLEERQLLLVNFCCLFKTDDTTNQKTLPDYPSITKFCQQLVDYISLGHFEVYESLVSESKTEAEASLKLAESLYPEIQKTTSRLFNIHHNKPNNKDDSSGHATCRRVAPHPNLFNTSWRDSHSHESTTLERPWRRRPSPGV